MLTLAQAQARIINLVRPLGTETLPLIQCLHRISTDRVTSSIDLPVFDNSAMDGYAVRATDLASASAERPATLQLIGRVAAGETFSRTVRAGQCVRLFTGSPLPPGADAVVMQEDTRVEVAEPDRVWFLDTVKPGENIRRHGQDVSRGTVLLEPGQELTVGRICLLAAGGTTFVRVGRQPVVGLLATGNELQEGGKPLGPGQIYECNRTALAAWLPRCGATIRLFPLTPDTSEATRSALEQAFQLCDVVLTSGGVSVGESDWIKPAFHQMGGELDFWRIAVKPGKPFAFGQWRGKFLFGLPGNPVSALVTFHLLVRPALARLQGATAVALPSCSACLAEALSNDGDRPHFMRVTIDTTGNARSAGKQASHALSSLASSDGLVEVPAGKTLPQGSLVRVLRWE